MSTNPYEAPKAEAVQQSTPNEDRWTALHNVRMAMLILLVPAGYNFICFNFPSNADQIDLPIYTLYRAVNLVGLVLVVSVVWFFGLTFCELVTGGIHAIVARKSRLEDWKAALYRTLRRAPVLAVPGAALWAIWVAAFYQARLGFFVVSVPVAVAGHLLAACLYVPLIYRWYKMERSAARQTIA